MSYLGGAKPRRPWRVLVLVVIAMLLLILAFALWSEDEDLGNLPPSEVQSGETEPGEPAL